MKSNLNLPIKKKNYRNHTAPVWFQETGAIHSFSMGTETLSSPPADEQVDFRSWYSVVV